MSNFEQMNKDGYLREPAVRGFVDYLVKLLSGGTLDHACKVVHPRWRRHISPGTQKKHPVTVLFRNLEDAREKYFWIADDDRAEGEGVPGESAGCDLDTNARILRRL